MTVALVNPSCCGAAVTVACPGAEATQGFRTYASTDTSGTFVPIVPASAVYISAVTATVIAINASSLTATPTVPVAAPGTANAGPTASVMIFPMAANSTICVVADNQKAIMAVAWKVSAGVVLHFSALP